MTAPRKPGRPPRHAGNARTALLRVSPRDLERWRALAEERGYADAYDMIAVAVEQLDPGDEQSRLAALGRDVLALVKAME